MMTEIRLGTTTGVVFLAPRKTTSPAVRVLEPEDVVALAHPSFRPKITFAGTYGEGIFRSPFGGRAWEKLPLNAGFIRTIVFDPSQRNVLYVGAEPANLFRSSDSGDSWTDLHIRRFPQAAGWSLPYSPRGGALRTLVLHPREPQLIIAGVEQGGVLISRDGGNDWQLITEGVDIDVHTLAIHPENPGILFAATGNGLFVTRDGCATWVRLFDDYTRAVLVHPEQHGLVFAGPAHAVGEGGRIVRSQDGGRTWDLASEGLDLPMADMVEHFHVSTLRPKEIFAVGSKGSVWRSPVEPVRWEPFATDVPSVQCLDIARVRTARPARTS